MISRRLVLYVGSLALNGVASFLALAILTRWLSNSEYGRLGLSVSASLLVNAVLYQWIRAYALRVLPASAPERTSVVLGVMIINIGLSAIFGFMVLVAIRQFNLSDGELLSWQQGSAIFVLALSQGLYELSLAGYRVRDQDSAFFLSSSSRAALSVVLASIAASYFGVSIVVLYALAASYLFISVMFPLKTKLSLDFKVLMGRRQLMSKELQESLNYGLPLVLATALTLVNPVVSRLYISSYSGEGELAVFVASVDTMQLLVLNAFMSINFIYFNRIARSRDSSDTSAFAANFKQYSLGINVVSLSCAFSLMMAAPFFFEFLIAKSISVPAKQYCGLAIGAATLIGLKQFWLDQMFYLEKRTGVLALVSAIAVALNLAALVILPINDQILRAFVSLILANAIALGVGVISNFSSDAYLSNVSRLMVGVVLVVLLALSHYWSTKEHWAYVMWLALMAGALIATLMGVKAWLEQRKEMALYAREGS